MTLTSEIIYNFASNVMLTYFTFGMFQGNVTPFLGLSVLDLGPMYTTDRRQTRIIA